MLRIGQKDPNARVRCSFKNHDPNNPEYEKCGLYTSWSRLREHLLVRKHKPRDRCTTCGDIFTDDDGWDQHTSARTCKWSPKSLEVPFWVERDQATSIRNLSTQGRKNHQSIDEMYREVYVILFGRDNGPARSVWAHPTIYPHSQHTVDLGIHHHRQEPRETLRRTIRDALGMRDVPGDDSMQRVIEAVRSYDEVSSEQTCVVQSHEPELGEAAVDEQLRYNEVITGDWMPSATLSEWQVPRIPGPDGYATEGLVGESEQPISDLCPYFGEGTGNLFPPVALGPAQAFSMTHKLDKPNHDSQYVSLA